MKIGMAMAAAKLVAVIVLPTLLQVAICAAGPSGHEAPEARKAKPVLRRLRPGQQQLKVLAAHSQKSSRRQGLRNGSPEQLEMWYDSGLAAQSVLATADIATLTAGITAKEFQAELHSLVDSSAPSRFIGRQGNGVAATHIEASFKKLGLQTEVQALGTGWNATLSQYAVTAAQLSGNVIGYLRGTDRANELVIVACHYDSVNWEDLTGAAPGVDDNGSGVALMLLLAKALSQSSAKPRRSLLFVSFQAEEEGLVGSKAFAQMFAPGGPGVAKYGQPVAAIVADEVAWPGKTAAARKVIFETKGRSKGTDTVVDTLAHASQQQCNSGFHDCVDGFVVNYHGFGSDHIPLLDVGVPAVLLIERDNMYHADTWGHSDQDNFKHIDAGFGAATTRLALQAVAALASPSS
jgi:hypothetical protein